MEPSIEANFIEDLQLWVLLLMLFGNWDSQRNVRRVLERQRILLNKQESDGLKLRWLIKEVTTLASKVRELEAQQ